MLTTPKTDSSLKIVQNYLYKNLGWDIDINEKTYEESMKRVSKALGGVNLDTLLQNLENQKNDTKIIQAFAREFSVGESYFFRDPNFFDLFEHHIIPEMIKKNNYSLNIWSVGCSRGEEAYSVAMMLHKNIPNIEKWNLIILGTDVNTHLLEKAKEGIFQKWSFRAIPDFYMKKYFQPLGEMYEIHPLIREMVHFTYHNITSGQPVSIPSNVKKFDLIIFKNVLIYLKDDKAKTVTKNLFSILNEGGYLATTPVEYGPEIFDFPHSNCCSSAWIIQKPYESNQPFNVPEAKYDDHHHGDIADNREYRTYDDVIDLLLSVEKKNSPTKKVLEKNEPYTYYLDALRMIESGDTKGAKTSLLKSIYLEKHFVVGYITLANILRKEEKYVESLKHINRAKSILKQMASQDEVPLTNGLMVKDLLMMIDTIKEESIG